MNPILAENARRNAALVVDYDPIKGIGCCGERAYHAPSGCYLPRPMLDDPKIAIAPVGDALDRLRCRYDFEFWCARCIKVRHKLTGRDVPFILNAPQRRVAAMIEEDRLAGRPLRLIMLKARQWGGSTLIQMYFAWIQCVHRRNWHSLICAHVKDTAATIRGMYSKALELYPQSLWEGAPGGGGVSPPHETPHETPEPPAFKAFERSVNTRVIAGRGCRVTLASAEKQESARGQDVSLAHLSEVAFWRASPQHDPADFVRAITSGIPYEPLTFIAMESTADGVANFFHAEWLRAEAGDSDKRPVFVPWHEIEIYRLPVDDPVALYDSLDPYEQGLWKRGLTLEMINWYRHKRREYPTHSAMQAEYPTDPVEAFTATSRGVFDRMKVQELRLGCSDPAAVGEIQGEALTGPAALDNIRFVPDPKGCLKLWEEPIRIARYIVAVDIGGRSLKSDYSVIAVLRKPRLDGELPRVVAQWRGHTDHDILAWRAAAIARHYNDALLVVESNTLECDCDGNAAFILEQISRHYRHLFYRISRDNPAAGYATRPGFHTNRSTKALVINTLIAAVRDSAYQEADAAAADELDTYELTPTGAYAARPGYHDDILMTRAIALYVLSCPEYNPPPQDFSALLNAPSW